VAGHRAGRRERVRGHRVGARQPGADVVGRVGQLRVDDDVPGPAAEQRRQRGDELLGADQREHGVRVDADPVAAGQPSGRRLTQRRGAVGGRVPGSVGGRPERVLHHLRDRVHGRARGQVHDPVRMGPGFLAVRGEQIPGEPGQPCGEGQLASPCGGSAATMGWSLLIFPTLEAPPGEPSSLKNSTFAL